MGCKYSVNGTDINNLSENEFKAYLLNGGLKALGVDMNFKEPPPPPKPPKEESKEEPKSEAKWRSVSKNLIYRSKFPTSTKELLLADPEAIYFTLPQEQVREFALSVIEEVGVEKAVLEASSSKTDLEPYERVMILGAAMDYYAKASKDKLAKGDIKAANEMADQEIDAQERLTEIASILAKLGTSFGRAISMFNEIYKLSNIALVRKLKKQVERLNQLNKPLLDEDIKQVSKIVDSQDIAGVSESLTEQDAQKYADLSNKITALEKEIADLKKQVAERNNAPKGSKKNPIVVNRKTNATEYDKRIKNLFKSRSGISPEDLSDLSYIGLYHLENGLTKFGDWVAEMNKKLSKFKEYFKDIYNNEKDKLIADGADATLFDNDTVIDTVLDEMQKKTDAKKMAEATKKLAIAQLKQVMDSNPDRARIQAPKIAAERIRRDAERNLGMVSTKNEQTYLKRLVQVINQKAKEYYKETNQTVKNTNDILAFAIANNKADYKIWDRTKEEVERQIDADENLTDSEKQDVKDFLSDYTDTIFDTLLTNKQQEDLVRKKLIEAGYKTTKTVKGKVVEAVDWNKIIGNAKNIKEAKQAIKKAVLDLGFSDEQSKPEIEALTNLFDQKVLEKKQNAINNYLNKNLLNKLKGKIKPKVSKTKVQRLLDMSNKGMLNDNRVKDVLAEELGITSISQQEFDRVNQLLELIDNPKIPIFIRKKYEEELQFIFDKKGGNITYLEFREFLANNRLTSLYNNIQNLTGWFRAISTFITTSIKTRELKGMAKVLKKEFVNSLSDAFTVLLTGDVSRGTSFSDFTRSTEGEPRVRYLEKGEGKLLGLPDLFVKLGSKTYQLNPLNAAYRKVKYVSRFLESADTVPSNVISGLTQYWQVKKQLKTLHPEWSNKKLEAESFNLMYNDSLLVAGRQAIEGFREAGIVPTKYQLNRAINEINERNRNDKMAKEFYDVVDNTKPLAEQRLKSKGITTPTDEEILKEVYTILGRDEPLDLVARGERQALRETGKRTTRGLSSIVLFPVNALNNSLKKQMLAQHSNRERWLINAGDAAVTYLLPFANSIGRWIEMGIELSPYGVLKGIGYKTANKNVIFREQDISQEELSELGDDYIIRGIQGTSMLLAAMYFQTLLAMLDGDDEEEDDIKVFGTYEESSFAKKRVQQVGKPEQTLSVYGRNIPLGLFGNASYPLIMYKDFLDRQNAENEKHGILYITAAMYLTTTYQSVGSRIGSYGSILGGIISGKEERYMPQIGKFVGSSAASSLIPFNRLQQEIGQLWNPKSEQSLTFGENLLQQFSIVGSISKDKPSFDYRNREYDFGEMYTGSADGIVKMFQKSKRADAIDKHLAEIDFAATDAFRESKNEENYKYTIVMPDGNNRFMTIEEYYDFRRNTAAKFNEKLLKNFEIVKNVKIENEKGQIDDELTKAVQNDVYSKMLTKSKEEALDIIQAKTGFVVEKNQQKKEKKEDNSLLKRQKAAQLRGLEY